MNNRVKTILIIIAAALALLFSSSAAAENSSWDHTATFYLWAASLEGTSGMGNAPDIEVDASFSDIIENLDMAFMGKYRAKKDVWAINAELMYVGLGGSASGPGGLLTGTAELKQSMLELSGGYEIQPGLDILAGLRYVNIDTTIDINGLLNRSRSDSWVDPIVGVEFRTPVSDKWSFYGRGDIGGFGVGSDLTWQLGAIFNYQMTDTWSTSLGYRVLDIDYDNGKTGPERFKYEIQQSGPVLGLTAKF